MLNPLRYRGYIYDEETNLYYLRSRYYNPLIGRFVNADTSIGRPYALLAHAIFMYCLNNPIVCVDIDGRMSEWLKNSASDRDLLSAHLDLAYFTQLKHIGTNSLGALEKIDEHQECCIKPSAEEFGIEKEMIEAVLFRELICVGMDDIVGDTLFLLFGRDCSTGIGQIKMSTAKAAETAVMGSCNKEDLEMWFALQDECTNVRYVAMNLKSICDNNDLYIPPKMDASRYSAAFKVFARYNGKRLNDNTGAYATAVERYYKAFKNISRR